MTHVFLDAKKLWFDLATPLLEPQSVQICWNTLAEHYTSENRHYHSLTHILELLDWADRFRGKLNDFNSICLAIWYHDVIYVASQNNNEKQSAQLAINQLLDGGMESGVVSKIGRWIEATAHHQNPNLDTDLGYFLDFDMAILGADPERYLQYTEQVRKEYAIVPKAFFNHGRRKVLEHFLFKPKIYFSPDMCLLLELNARRNLAREMEVLE